MFIKGELKMQQLEVNSKANEIKSNSNSMES